MQPETLVPLQRTQSVLAGVTTLGVTIDEPAVHCLRLEITDLGVLQDVGRLAKQYAAPHGCNTWEAASGYDCVAQISGSAIRGVLSGLRLGSSSMPLQQLFGSSLARLNLPLALSTKRLTACSPLA